MEKSRREVDKAAVDRATDEEDTSVRIQPASEQARTKEQSEQTEKQVNMLDIIKNFFKNNFLRKSSSPKKRKKANVDRTLIYDTSKSRDKNDYNKLVTKGSRDVGSTNGKAAAENGSNGASVVHGQFTGNISRPESSDISSKIGRRDNSSNRLAQSLSLAPSTQLRSGSYGNLRLPPKEDESISAQREAVLKKEQENDSNKDALTNAGAETIYSKIIHERPPELPPRNSLPQSSSSDCFKRSTLASARGERRYVNVKPRFNVMKFIQNNVKKVTNFKMHSSGIVLLNDDNDSKGVQFTKLKSDFDPIKVNNETGRTLINPNLMSGGNVVFEEYSKMFKPLDFYAIDPIVIEEIPDRLELPRTSPLEVQPATRPPLLTTSCSGGGVIEDERSTTASLPELFPSKKTPPRTMQNPLFGGGIVESDDIENEIYVDLFSRILRFDINRKDSRTSEDSSNNS